MVLDRPAMRVGKLFKCVSTYRLKMYIDQGVPLKAWRPRELVSVSKRNLCAKNRHRDVPYTRGNPLIARSLQVTVDGSEFSNVYSAAVSDGSIYPSFAVPELSVSPH